MRKIETQMNTAIANGITKQSANTAVTYDDQFDVSRVYLLTRKPHCYNR